MRSLKAFLLSLLLLIAAFPFLLLPRPAESQAAVEAPTGFDNQTNGCVDQATHDEDRATFESVEDEADGLGPPFNGTSCAGCHSTPVTGGVELRHRAAGRASRRQRQLRSRHRVRQFRHGTHPAALADQPESHL